jgi:cyclic pyranopterin phosphate synthase
MLDNDTELPSRLTHFDRNGSAVMVDVTEKSSTHRVATAKGKIKVNAETFEAICRGTAKKGDVLGVARIAGIMAAKKTPELIPLCHPLMLTECTVDFSTNAEKLEVEAVCTVKVTGQTGVEMEALTGVSVALLTIYDMCKAIDKSMEISTIRLVRKSGGKSGEFINPNEK